MLSEVLSGTPITLSQKHVVRGAFWNTYNSEPEICCRRCFWNTDNSDLTYLGGISLKTPFENSGMVSKISLGPFFRKVNLKCQEIMKETENEPTNSAEQGLKSLKRKGSLSGTPESQDAGYAW